MICRIAEPEELESLSKLSVSLGNIPFMPGQVLTSVACHNGEIIGFAAVQEACHAAGSWIAPEYRRKGHTYALRECLEKELRLRGVAMYFSLPGNEFERALFSKYGPVTERIAQVKVL